MNPERGFIVKMEVDGGGKYIKESIEEGDKNVSYTFMKLSNNKFK